MRKRNLGFTLGELMLTVTVAGVLTAIAVPNMTQFLRNNRITSAVNDLLAATYMARAEAIKTRAQTVFCFTSDPTAALPDCNGDGDRHDSEGWIVFVDDVAPGTVEATDNNGIVDAGERVVLRHAPLPDALSVKSKPDGSAGYLAFSGGGFSRSVAALGIDLTGIVLCDSRGNAALYGVDNSAARGLLIAQTGRPRVTKSVSEIETDASLDGCP